MTLSSTEWICVASPSAFTFSLIGLTQSSSSSSSPSSSWIFFFSPRLSRDFSKKIAIYFSLQRSLSAHSKPGFHQTQHFSPIFKRLSLDSLLQFPCKAKWTFIICCPNSHQLTEICTRQLPLFAVILPSFSAVCSSQLCNLIFSVVSRIPQTFW